MEQVGVLDFNWLASSNLFEYVLKNGDKILVTEDEFHRIFKDGIQMESGRDKVYAPIFSSDGGEVVAWELIGDKQYTWADLVELSKKEWLSDWLYSLKLYDDKEDFFSKNDHYDEEEKSYYERLLKNYSDEEKIIILNRPNGQEYFYQESDIQELMEDSKTWV